VSAATSIVWFRRDLRLTDNPALAAACERYERVLALYAHAPDEDGEWAAGGASRWWLHHSLAALDASLRACGGRLCLRIGGSLETLLEVARETRAAAVFFNRLYEPAASARDAVVEAALSEAGLACESFNAALLNEPREIATAAGQPYRVFTPYWRACLPRLDGLPRPVMAPAKVRAPQPFPASVPLAELGLAPRIRWDAGLA